MTVYTKEFLVTKQETAQAMGSGDLAVLATPAVIAMAENTANKLYNQELTAQQTSVGAFISIKHLKPSQIGATIQVVITNIQEAKGKKTFFFEVFDQKQLIAKGKHQRVVVNRQTFLKN